MRADHPGSLPLPALTPEQESELAAYNLNRFDLGGLRPGCRFPLPDEPFVPFWESVVADSRSEGAFAALRARLPQLAFPVQAGVSRSEPYQAATLRGRPVAQIPEATGLALAHPEAIEVSLHLSPAGRIALLVARRREEFESLLRALARRNEPEPIPPAQGALMVSGYNNWCRIGELRSRWEELEPDARAAATWPDELRRLEGRKELYQDRFILLSDGPYSAVPAAELGLGDDEWREVSLVIRREHECAHYLTRRLFGSMRNHLLDELIADYAGLVAACGAFRADWFLRFLGLDDYPRIRAGGRVEIYRGDPPLSEGAFRRLAWQVREAALRLERFDRARAAPPDLATTARTLTALAAFRLDELAAPGAGERLAATVARLAG